MTEVPPGREGSDDVDDLYRRASDLDASRPSDSTRRRILHHAAQLAEQRAAQNDAAGLGRRRAANQPWWRPAIFGTLAAAALAGLLVTPRFFAPGTSPTAAVSPAQVSRPSPALAPPPAAQSARQSPRAAADTEPNPPPPAEGLGNLEPRTIARNAAQSAEPAAELAAKNAPAKAQSEIHARSGLVAGDRAVDAKRMQGASGAQSAAPAAPPAPATTPAPAPVTALAARAPEASDLAAQLRRAAETGDIPELQMLLDKQPVIDARDADGRTALMLSTLHGRGQAVDVLLAHGADPNAADGHGVTPLQAAVAGHQQAIVEALQRAGAR
jgi:hypothetical protein